MQEMLRTYKANIFRALSHPTRIAILELLRHQIVVNRKDGNQVFYSIRNPVMVQVLDIMRRYIQGSLADAVQMLEEVEGEVSRL